MIETIAMTLDTVGKEKEEKKSVIILHGTFFFLFLLPLPPVPLNNTFTLSEWPFLTDRGNSSQKDPTAFSTIVVKMDEFMTHEKAERAQQLTQRSNKFAVISLIQALKNFFFLHSMPKAGERGESLGLIRGY